MRQFLFVLLLFACGSAFPQISQVEYDILKVRFADHIKNERFEEALESLGDIRSSGYAYPQSLDYFEGFALQELGRLVEAEAAYKNYLNTAGAGGDYYARALQRVVALEQPIGDALGAYRSALANNADEAKLKRLETVLGPIAVPMRAEWQAAKDRREREERLAAEREAARLAQLKQARRNGTYALTHGYENASAYLQDFEFLADGTVVAVGSIFRKDCADTELNVLFLHLEISGDILSDRQECSAEQGTDSDAFYRDLHITSAGHIITVGANNDSGRQVGGVAQIREDGSNAWISRLDMARWKKKFRQRYGSSEYRGSELTARGMVYAVGRSWSNQYDNWVPRLVAYSAEGRHMWDNVGFAHSGATFRNIVEHEPRRLTVVGYIEKNDRRRGFLEVWGPFMGNVHAIALKTHKHDWDTEFSDAAPTPDGGTMVVGVAMDKGTRGGGRAYLVKFNRKGKPEWSRQLDHYSKAWPRRILRHGDGFVVNGWAEVDGDTQGWVFKVTGNGDPVWSEIHGGAGWQSVNSLKPLPDGSGFLGVGSSDSDAWIIKLDNQGAIL